MNIEEDRDWLLQIRENSIKDKDKDKDDDIVKGGVGSGIKGHQTSKNNTTKIMQDSNLKSAFNQ